MPRSLSRTRSLVASRLTSKLGRQPSPKVTLPRPPSLPLARSVADSVARSRRRPEALAVSAMSRSDMPVVRSSSAAVARLEAAAELRPGEGAGEPQVGRQRAADLLPVESGKCCSLRGVDSALDLAGERRVLAQVEGEGLEAEAQRHAGIRLERAAAEAGGGEVRVQPVGLGAGGEPEVGRGRALAGAAGLELADGKVEARLGRLGRAGELEAALGRALERRGAEGLEEAERQGCQTNLAAGGAVAVAQAALDLGRADLEVELVEVEHALVERQAGRRHELDLLAGELAAEAAQGDSLILAQGRDLGRGLHVEGLGGLLAGGGERQADPVERALGGELGLLQLEVGPGEAGGGGGGVDRGLAARVADGGVEPGLLQAAEVAGDALGVGLQRRVLTALGRGKRQVEVDRTAELLLRPGRERVEVAHTACEAAGGEQALQVELEVAREPGRGPVSSTFGRHSRWLASA